MNSVFCNIGLKLGAKRILDTAKRFGFYERPPLETPADERLPSGLYRDGRLYYPQASTRTSTPGGWPSDRSGCSSRRSRWRWSQARSASAGS